MPRGDRGARATVTRPRVLRAAITLADTEGLDAVSMRRLADTLGVVPMALYKHVADKDDLLDGVVDLLIDDLPEAPALPDRQWRSAVRSRILGARSIVVAHPWARRAIESRTLRTPTVLRHMEALTQAFLRGGFTPDLTHHVMHLLGNRIWGFSPELFDETRPTPATTRARTSGTPRPEDYPGILAIAADARGRRPGATGCDEDFEFEFALDVLLDGIARLHRGHWDSRTT